MSHSKHFADLLYKRKHHELGNMEHSPEFLVRIDVNEFQKWKTHKSEIPLVQVVDSKDVFITNTGGHSGTLSHPSREQLMDAFGSTHFEEIFDFMAVNGHVKESTKHGSVEGREGRASMM